MVYAGSRLLVELDERPARRGGCLGIREIREKKGKLRFIEATEQGRRAGINRCIFV